MCPRPGLEPRSGDECINYEATTLLLKNTLRGYLNNAHSDAMCYKYCLSLIHVSQFFNVFFSEIITVLVSDPIFARLAEIGNVGSAEAETSGSESEQHGPTMDSDLNTDMSNSEPTKKSRASFKMTDLLLQRSAAKSAKKHGGTGVDEFMEEIPMQKQRRSTRRKLYELPPKLKQTMGQANILWARGEIDQAKGICMELIRQGTENNLLHNFIPYSLQSAPLTESLQQAIERSGTLAPRTGN